MRNRNKKFNGGLPFYRSDVVRIGNIPKRIFDDCYEKIKGHPHPLKGLDYDDEWFYSS